MRTTIGRGLLRVLRYDLVGSPPPDPVCVFVAYPHTSWLDLPLMLGIAWSSDLSPGFLAKQELFRAPFGRLLRSVGGIAVDRANPGSLVADLTERARSGRPFGLVIAPEGTRGGTGYWKSGFYRIASEAGVPLALGFVDRPTRTAGFGPSFPPSGDVVADMDRVRAFYADKHGAKPRPSAVPTLREEGVEPPELRPAPAG
jgi:1-acyl-sn-glycerol-3-phosphate acyltransferase